MTKKEKKTVRWYLTSYYSFNLQNIIVYLIVSRKSVDQDFENSSLKSIMLNGFIARSDNRTIEKLRINRDTFARKHLILIESIENRK